MAIAQLKLRQYSDDVDLTPELEINLEMMRRICMLHLPWRIQLVTPPRAPLVVYSDASYEPEVSRLPRLGWLIFDPLISTTKPVIAKTLDIPQDIVDLWKPRSQQIFPAEAFAPLAACFDDPDTFSNRDALWFIDNEAAASTLIRGATAQEDVQHIAEATQLLWTTLFARVWIEWIDSDSNPSDGLSRDGLCDAWCRAHGVVPTLAGAPPWSSTDDLVEAFLARLEHTPG